MLPLFEPYVVYISIFLFLLGIFGTFWALNALVKVSTRKEDIGKKTVYQIWFFIVGLCIADIGINQLIPEKLVNTTLHSSIGTFGAAILLLAAWSFAFWFLTFFNPNYVENRKKKLDRYYLWFSLCIMWIPTYSLYVILASFGVTLGFTIV